MASFNGRTRRQRRISPDDSRPRRVAKCEACGKATTAQNKSIICDKCGKDVGFVSSYGACTHDVIHTWEERYKCEGLQAKERRERAAKGGRVKEVCNTGEIPHLWAHKAQQTARNKQGNLFFHGNTIYSYGSHFPIASHVTNKRGQAAVFFTTDTYSNTTAGHCSAVRQAIPKSVQVFCVPQVEARDPQSNIPDYINRVSRLILKAGRARNRKAYLMSEASEIRKEAFAYAKFFGLKEPKIPAISEKELARAKADVIKREAAERKKNKEILDAFTAAWPRMAEAWVNHENLDPETLPNRGTYPKGFDIPALLRITGDEVETSRGARFPVSHAKRGLALVRSVMARGEEWKANGHTCKLGYYTIERIEANGTVHAGCHVVPWSSIERIAPALDAYTKLDADQAVSELERGM